MDFSLRLPCLTSTHSVIAIPTRSRSRPLPLSPSLDLCLSLPILCSLPALLLSPPLAPSDCFLFVSTLPLFVRLSFHQLSAESSQARLCQSVREFRQRNG